jgi:hypothetical protein
VKSRRAVDPIAIGERDSRHVEFLRGFNEIFGHGSTLQKTEGGAGVQFNVSQS